MIWIIANEHLSLNGFSASRPPCCVSRDRNNGEILSGTASRAAASRWQQSRAGKMADDIHLLVYA
jgi:hypothetical protein